MKGKKKLDSEKKRCPYCGRYMNEGRRLLKQPSCIEYSYKFLVPTFICPNCGFQPLTEGKENEWQQALARRFELDKMVEEELENIRRALRRIEEINSIKRKFKVKPIMKKIR